MNRNLPLLALAIGAFAIGTTEFSPMGLLPNIAHDLGVSIPRAGLLITGYAMGVMLGAPIMTLYFGHFSRRKALILLMSFQKMVEKILELMRLSHTLVLN